MCDIIISLCPKWCKLILSGKKTVELRKSRPRIEPPFHVYLYETKAGKGQVVGECICYKIEKYRADFTSDSCYEDIRRIDVNEDSEEEEDVFITSNEFENPNDCYLCKKSKLTFEEIKQYIFNGKSGFFEFYGWYLAKVTEYKKARQLSALGLQRAPQSWCYVKEMYK